ncbi:hypothetical protein [Caulobacter segnis]
MDAFRAIRGGVRPNPGEAGGIAVEAVEVLREVTFRERCAREAGTFELRRDLIPERPFATEAKAIVGMPTLGAAANATFGVEDGMRAATAIDPKPEVRCRSASGAVPW